MCTKKYTKEYFIPLITDEIIAREIINSSAMDNCTRQTFECLLDNFNSSEDWNLLVDRLANNQPETY